MCVVCVQWKYNVAWNVADSWNITHLLLVWVFLSLSQSLSEVLFPQLDAVCHYVQSLFESKNLATRDTALRVHETLLVSLSHTLPLHVYATKR